MLWGFKDVYSFNFDGVPQSDGVIERTSNDFRVIVNLLVRFLFQSAWFQSDDFNDRVSMSFNVVRLLAHLDSEGTHVPISENKQDILVDINLNDPTVGHLLLDCILLTHVDVSNVDVAHSV